MIEIDIPIPFEICSWALLWPIYISEGISLGFSCHSPPWQRNLVQGTTCPTVHSNPAEKMESVCGYVDLRNQLGCGFRAAISRSRMLERKQRE